MNKLSQLNMKVSKSIFKFISKCIERDIKVEINQEREVDTNGMAVYPQDKYRFTFVVDGSNKKTKYKTANQLIDKMNKEMKK